MKLKHIITILFIPVVIFLSYLIYHSIDEKSRTIKDIETSENSIKEKLSFLKEVQLLHYNTKGEYASTWPEVTQFLKKDSVYIVEKKEEVITLYYGADSISITYDTIGSVPVIDTLRASVEKTDQYHLDSIPLIPGRKDSFALKTGKVDGLPVFEIKDIYPINERRTYGIPGYDTLKMGSLKNVAIKGNWEK